MNKIIITKFNNEIKEKQIENNNKNNLENENIINLLEIKDNDIDKYSITITNNFIRDVFKKYKFNKNTKKLLHILNSNSNIELLNLYNYILKNFNKITENSPQKRKEEIYKALTKCTTKNKEIIIKIIIYQLINICIKEILNNISKEKLNEIYMMVIRNEDIINILKKLNITINNKYHNLFKKIMIKKIYFVHEKKIPHLCWQNCKNVSNCEKMDDVLTELISKYDFITSGYQIVNIDTNENEHFTYTIDKFYVTGCKKYKKIKKQEI